MYFYARDETIGCTREACAFRDNLAAFTSIGADVVGVSVQDRDSHRAFADHHQLPFPLVADPTKAIARSYGVLGLLGVAKRVTYLVDPSGRIADAYRSEIDPASHAEHARQRLRELRGATPTSS